MPLQYISQYQCVLLIINLQMKTEIIVFSLLLAVWGAHIQQASLEDPLPCIEKNCPNQWAACQKDPKCVPALQDCEKKCGTSQGCWGLCLQSKGSQAAIDVAKCAAANHCLNAPIPSTAVAVADPLPCIEKNCPNQWAACQKDPKCVPALQDCEKKCGTSQGCWGLCLQSKGSQAAIDVAKCAAANHCLNAINPSTAVALADPLPCIEKNCPNQWAACQKDPKCLPALQDCEKKCGTSQGCWGLCLQSKGSQAAIDVAKCAAANHCLNATSSPKPCKKAVAVADPLPCIEKNCPDQWAACQKDPKCVPALQDCDKKCGTNQGCWGLCLQSKGSPAAISVAKCAAANHCV